MEQWSDDFFVGTYIRNDSWKLIVNNTADCYGHDGGSGGARDFWVCFDGETSRVQ